MFSGIRRIGLRLRGQAVDARVKVVDSGVEGVNPRGKLAMLAAVLLAKLAKFIAKPALLAAGFVARLAQIAA